MSTKGPIDASRTETAPQAAALARPPAAAPGLLLAFAAKGVQAGDRAPVRGRLVVGRGTDATYSVRDSLLSRAHFEVTRAGGELIVRDLGSRNGTFADGAPVTEARRVGPGTVIRAGGCLFVTTADLGTVGEAGEEGFPGFAGRFHGPAVGRRLRVAARTGRHVLIEGESGVGKELAARYLHDLGRASGRAGPLVARNAALFASEEDAVAGLFGVARGVFTGVDERAGAIEAASRGTLFLDELHNLPSRVQRTLLRFVEDGIVERVGGATSAPRDVRVIFGTNQPVEQAVRAGALAHDLVARLHRVELPPLRERRADVADIFVALLERAPRAAMADRVLELLDAELVEGLLRRSYAAGNVRELEDLAALLLARLGEGEEPAVVLADLLGAGRPARDEPAADQVPFGSVYELHRAEITDAFFEVDGNLSALESLLRERGIPCSRRWLSTYLERWGVRRVRRRG